MSFSSISKYLIGVGLLTALVQPLPASAGTPIHVLITPAISQTAAPVMATQNVNCAVPANPVVAENCLPGTTDWIVTNFSSDLSGYAAPSSVNLGETIKFFVTTRDSTYSLAIYRSGYYHGSGGRLVKRYDDLPGKAQPACYTNLQTGLASCSNWTAAITLTIPTDWVSGMYTVKLSGSHGDNFAVFTVRDDARKSDILYQQSLFTSQAYNKYAGKSIYDNNAVNLCTTGLGLPRAVQVSFSRPLFTGDMRDAAAGNSYFKAEYSMVRWLESQGYDVTYSNTLDTTRSGEPGAKNYLLDHKVFMSSGHDEYWTQQMHDAITAARDAGVNIAFFSGNTSYWRVRLEADPLTGEPDSVMTIYKTTQSGPPDPVMPTTTWRDRNGVNNPENGLLGTEYVGDNDLLHFPLQISADQARDRVYRHTGLNALPPHTAARVGDRVIGWEWDSAVDNGHTPRGLTVLASSPTFGFLLKDDGNFSNGTVGTATVQVSRYQAASGALVYSTGTILWSWGLGAQGVQVTPIDPTMQQVTYNMLADMHALPATPSPAIILDSAQNSGAAPDLSHVHVVADRAFTPMISNLQADPTAEYGAVVISWQTDVPTNGQIWLGDTAAHPIEPSDPALDFTRDHSITVNLTDKFDQVLYYRVAGMDQDGHSVISDVRGFGTGYPGLRTSVHQGLDNTIQATRCWLQANPAAPIGLAVVIVLLIGLIGLQLVQRARRLRKRSVSPVTPRKEAISS